MSNDGMLEVNGRLFAPAGYGQVAAPDSAQRALNGFYKPSTHGVLLLDTKREPFAFASSNDGGFLVTAHRAPDGRVRYMFGLAGYTEEALGITGHIHGRDTAVAILRQCGFFARPTWDAPDPEASDDANSEPEGMKP